MLSLKEQRGVPSRQRAHILEGRMMVLTNIEDVIRVIRESDDPKASLVQRFDLSDLQVEDVLNMRLCQLARGEGFGLEKELDILRGELSNLLEECIVINQDKKEWDSLYKLCNVWTSHLTEEFKHLHRVTEIPFETLMMISEGIGKVALLSGVNQEGYKAATTSFMRLLATDEIEVGEFNILAENSYRLLQVLLDSLGVTPGRFRRMVLEKSFPSGLAKRVFIGFREVDAEYSVLPKTVIEWHTLAGRGI